MPDAQQAELQRLQQERAAQEPVRTTVLHPAFRHPPRIPSDDSIVSALFSTYDCPAGSSCLCIVRHLHLPGKF